MSEQKPADNANLLQITDRVLNNLYLMSRVGAYLVEKGAPINSIGGPLLVNKDPQDGIVRRLAYYNDPNIFSKTIDEQVVKDWVAKGEIQGSLPVGLWRIILNQHQDDWEQDMMPKFGKALSQYNPGGIEDMVVCLGPKEKTNYDLHQWNPGKDGYQRNKGKNVSVIAEPKKIAITVDEVLAPVLEINLGSNTTVADFIKSKGLSKELIEYVEGLIPPKEKSNPAEPAKQWTQDEIKKTFEDIQAFGQKAFSQLASSYANLGNLSGPEMQNCIKQAFEYTLKSLYKIEPKSGEDKVIDITARLLNWEYRQADSSDLAKEYHTTLPYAPLVQGWRQITRAIEYLYQRKIQLDPQQKHELETIVQALKSNPELAQPRNKRVVKEITYIIRGKYDPHGSGKRLKHFFGRVFRGRPGSKKVLN